MNLNKGENLIVNGIYTFDEKYVYIVLNTKECLYLQMRDILREENVQELSNDIVCTYLSIHFQDFSVFDLLSISWLEEQNFQDGYLGTINEIAEQDLEKFKKIWIGD